MRLFSLDKFNIMEDEAVVAETAAEKEEREAISSPFRERNQLLSDRSTLQIRAMAISSVKLYPYQIEILLKMGMISRITADEMLRDAPTPPASQEAPVQEAMTSELGSRKLQL